MKAPDPNVFAETLHRAQAGDRLAQSQLCDWINEDLRQAAAKLVRNSNAARATSLVNELYLKLFDRKLIPDLKNRRYFFAVAIDQMRQILRERIRKAKRLKRGGRLERLPLDIVLDNYLGEFKTQTSLEYERVHDALEAIRGGTATERQYQLLMYQYFIGLSIEEAAELLEVSARTAARDLKIARAKLGLELRRHSGDDGN